MFTTLRPAAATLALFAALLAGSPATAASASVSSCRTLDTPGGYALTADLAAVQATCITITASDVKLDLAGHTISCTGSGFEGSCQVPGTVFNQGVDIAPNLSGVVVSGPGTISGFDTGIAINDSGALVKGITATGPACDPDSCARPPSTGIIILGRSSVSLLNNDLSHHFFGLRLEAVACPATDTCVVNGNALHHNTCDGILVRASSGHRLTGNVARSNGAAQPCFPRGGIVFIFGSTGNTVTNNVFSNNNGFGIRTGFGNQVGPQTSGNHILNNTAIGNTLADLSQVDGENSWNDNNRCQTQDGTVPASVCGAAE